MGVGVRVLLGQGGGDEPKGCEPQASTLGHAWDEEVTEPTSTVTTEDIVNGERVAGWGLRVGHPSEMKTQHKLNFDLGKG